MPDGFKIADGYVDITVDQAALDTAIAEVEAKLAAIKDRAIDIGINPATVAKQMAVIQAMLDKLQARIGVGINPAELVAAVTAIQAAIDKVQDRWNVRVEGIPAALAGLSAMNIEASKLSEHLKAARDAMAALAAISFTGVGGGGGVFGAWGAWFHWIVAGGAELLSVVIPATVALGSAALVASEGVQNVYQHMQALYTATEATYHMFGQTVGSALGLSSALQEAQKAADPMVYQALGGALQIAKGQFSQFGQTGLSVLREIDTFVAKLQYEMQNGLGNQVHGLFANMVTDLTELAQIFGNVGHAIVNFANAMPGLAQVLLSFLDTLSRLLLAISQLPSWILTTALVLEELYRWGGLAVTIFARLGAGIASLGTLGIPLITQFGARFAAVFTTLGETVGGFLINFGTAFERMGTTVAEDGTKVVSSVGKMGSSIADAGVGIGEAIAAVPGWAAALGVVLVGGFIALTIWASHAKTAVQEWADSMNTALAKTSDLRVVNTAASDLAQTTVKLSTAQDQLAQSLKNVYGSAAGAQSRFYQFNPVIQQQQRDVQTLTQEHQYLNQQMKNVYGSLGFLETRFGTTYTGALQLAQMAGVKLTDGLTQTSQAAAIDRLKIDDLIAGYRAMGTPMNVVGADMNALSVQAALQSTKVDALNQAWSNYINGLVGGVSGVASFATALGNISQLTTQVVDSTTGLTTTGTTQAGIQGFIQALQQGPGGAQGASAWTNFSQIVSGSMQTTINWLRQAGAEGVLSGGKFTQAVKDMIAQLVPFVGDNKTAISILSGLAQEAGGPATTSLQDLKKWLGNTGDASGNLSGIVQDTTQKMSDLNKVSQNLGNVLNQDIVATMDAAEIKTSGLSQVTQKYTQDLQNANTPATVLAQDHKDLVQLLTQLTGSAKTANDIVNTYTNQLQAAANAANNAGGAVNRLSGAINSMPTYIPVLNSLAQLQQMGWGSGQMTHAATGARIPGYGGGDIVPAMLEPGETVVSKEDTARYGPLFKAVGIRGFAQGGIVPAAGTVVNSQAVQAASAEGGLVINMNYFGPQMPSIEQNNQIARAIALKLVAPA